MRTPRYATYMGMFVAVKASWTVVASLDMVVVLHATHFTQFVHLVSML